MSKLDELIQQLCPEGVEWQTLNDIGEFFGGLTGKSKNDFIDGNAAFITYSNIYSNPSLNLNIDEKVRIDDGEKQNVIQYGDILFTGSSETPEECGMSSVVTKEPTEKMYLNSFCFGLRLFELDKFNFDYLKHLFRSAEIRKEICKTANGVTRFNVSKKKMGEIAIPLPPLPVQEEIVRLLDQLTETTQKYQAKLEAELDARKKQYEEYRNQLLTFDASRTDVEWEALNDCCVVQRGIRIVKKNLMEEGTVPVFQNSIAPMGYYDKSNYPANVSYIICAGSSSGSIGFCTVPFWAADDCLCVLSKGDIDNKFIYYYLQAQHSYIKTKVRGGAMPRLSRQVVENLKFPIISLTEQEGIVNILDRMDKTHKELCKSIETEIKMRKQQYEYYRNQLLDFKKKED